MEPTNAPDADSIRRYLLGSASADEQEQMEQRLLAEGAFVEEVSACEDELVDEYLCGRLNARERQDFEQVFLAAPSRQQKLRFALALRRLLDGAGPLPASAAAATDSPAEAGRAAHAGFFGSLRAGFFGILWNPARLAFASVVLCAAAVSLLLAVRASRQTAPRPDLSAANGAASGVGRAPASPAAPAVPARPNKRAPAGSKVLFVTLRPGLRRGGGEETERLNIPPGTDFIRFTLPLASVRHASYGVSVQTFEGREVDNITDLPADTRGKSPAVVLDLPAATLAPDDYRFKLSGLREGHGPEPLDTYAFRLPRP